LARAAATAILSLNQNVPPTKSSASTAPMIRPPVPKIAPMPMNRAPRKARSTNVLKVLMNVPRISNHLFSMQRPDRVVRSLES
jgi:hypothetical protein